MRPIILMTYVTYIEEDEIYFYHVGNTLISERILNYCHIRTIISVYLHTNTSKNYETNKKHSEA